MHRFESMASSVTGACKRRPLLVMVSLFALLWGACVFTFALTNTLPGGAGTDTHRTFVPYRAFFQRMLAEHNFPDIAPGMYGGHPIFSCGQSGIYFPTALIG